MNKFYDIIPTPKKMENTGNEIFDIKTIDIKGKTTGKTDHALSMITKETPFEKREGATNAVVIYYPMECAPEGVFKEDDFAMFDMTNAKAQGYVIKKKDGITCIGAESEMGVVYALMTLLQLLGKPVGDFIIRDWPDFEYRGCNWLIWAETAIWSYDFGDGKEAIKKRCTRKLDMCLKYKINYVHADGFGYDVDRFPEYEDIMRTLNDEARKRGIHFGSGGYGMSYGAAGHLNSYSGKVHMNRKSYPDGEVYPCIGSYLAWKLMPDCTVARHTRLTELKGREYGTCLSNEALFEEKMKEITEHIRRTHSGGYYIHNMDSHEIHPELWLARCDDCRKRWPNDDLFARDGAAGAFAEYFDKLMERVREVKDGDFDAERDTVIRMVSPGYLYANQFTEDPEFEEGVKFWGKIQEYMKDTRNFRIEFREQFFSHENDVPRVEIMKKYINPEITSLVNFCGADGFYDDKLFAPTTATNYIMKDYGSNIVMSGNAFQEPLCVFNAEYTWNCENSGFYNIENKPKNYEEFMKLYYDLMELREVPEEVFGDGGMLDVICEKLYGEKYGREIAKVFKVRGTNGEPPIACASNVDIYTNFNKVEYPMRWVSEMDEKEKDEKLIRFTECAKSSEQAYKILSDVLKNYDGDSDIKADLTWLCECFNMGRMLTARLREYMELYKELDGNFRNGTDFDNTAMDRLKALQERNKEFSDYVRGSSEKTVDRFDGSMMRREELADFLEYNTSLMMASIKENSRIPKDLRAERTHEWW